VPIDTSVSTRAVRVVAAGAVTIHVAQASPNHTATYTVSSPPAPETVHVSQIPEAGRTGLTFELLVHALDEHGNVDETFEREVK